MAQGDFTKEEAKEVTEIFKEVFQALSKPKKREFLGHANDIYIFLARAGFYAPTEAALKEALKAQEDYVKATQEALKAAASQTETKDDNQEATKPE